MKYAVHVLVAAAVLAPLAGIAYANDRSQAGGHHERGARMFEKADGNSDGALVLDEVVAHLSSRIVEADADKDGSVTRAEIVTAIEAKAENPRMVRRAGRIADMMVWRFDLDEDGKIALAEVENRARKRFALMDRNDDGRVEKAELARSMPMHGRKGFHHGRHGEWRGGAGAQSAQ